MANPLSWLANTKIVDTLQGQDGGYGATEALKQVAKINPAIGSADAIKDFYQGSVSPYLATNTPGAITAVEGRTWNPDGATSQQDAQTNESAVNLGNGTGYGSGSGGTGGYTAQELALLDNQIGSTQSALERLLGQRDIGYSNIDNSTIEEQNRLDQQKALAERNYNTQKLQQTQDYTDNRSSVRADAGRQYTALQRLLGSMGAGRSSAAQVLAPFAVGREAATRFGEVQGTFGRNQQGLDTAWGDTTRAYTDNVADLQRQREQKRRELESGILQNEAGLRDTLAQLQASKTANAGGDVMGVIAPQQSRIQQILSQIDELGRMSPVKALGNISYATPNVENYNYSRFDAPTVDQNAPGAGDYVSPLTALLKRKEQQLA